MHSICVENLSKRYRIARKERYYTLRDMLSRALKTPMRLLSRYKGRGQFYSQRSDPKWVWALRDVSFEVKDGEVLGVIGRNGAGKSTLLKILARITQPTKGYAEIRGRVGSLLEVGTGFHPELTGRENIYLNGAILGMRKAEIDRKFDEIVAFAEVEKFLDTPVKYYSSGMHMRLAFAVAAHLDPEILLVDEILAVGDINFQKKCIGKMGDVSKEGRTILFVSHQMNQIRRLCKRAMWLEKGEIKDIGDIHKIVSAYEKAMTSDVVNIEEVQCENENVKAKFLSWEIVNATNGHPHTLNSFEEVIIKFNLKVDMPIRKAHHGIALFDNGKILWGAAMDGLNFDIGYYSLIYSLPTLPIRPGSYQWRVSLYDEDGLVDCWDCIPEMIIATEPVAHPRDEWAGILNIPFDFTFVRFK
ncbi:MAG: ABC transporter ATP-binding protein [Bacteroidota bacterium]|nr:ABC transporter ATP-binding protein [Rhodothermia bacterium]MDW8285013.1 ABC transporter ATP-binding protein [Bacteroidota bacterium]